MLRFSERFKEMREYLGMNRSDYAKKLKIAPSTVARYENNEIDVTISAIDKIAEKLGVNIGWLLGIVDDMYEVEIPFRKIPILGSIRSQPALDFENYEGFEVLKSDYKADFCVRHKEIGTDRTGIVYKNCITFFKRQEALQSGDTVAVISGNNIQIGKYIKIDKFAGVMPEGGSIGEPVDESRIIGKAVYKLTEAF